MYSSRLEAIERNADAALIFSILIVFVQVNHMEGNADAGLAYSIFVLLIQASIAIFTLLARLKLRGLHQPPYPKPGIETQNTSHGVPSQATSRHRTQDRPLAASAPTQSRDPVAGSTEEAFGCTCTVCSGNGGHTRGTDYEKYRLPPRGGSLPCGKWLCFVLVTVIIVPLIAIYSYYVFRLGTYICGNRPHILVA